LLYYNK